MAPTMLEAQDLRGNRRMIKPWEVRIAATPSGTFLQISIRPVSNRWLEKLLEPLTNRERWINNP